VSGSPFFKLNSGIPGSLPGDGAKITANHLRRNTEIREARDNR